MWACEKGLSYEDYVENDAFPNSLAKQNDSAFSHGTTTAVAHL